MLCRGRLVSLKHFSFFVLNLLHKENSYPIATDSFVSTSGPSQKYLARKTFWSVSFRFFELTPFPTNTHQFLFASLLTLLHHLPEILEEGVHPYRSLEARYETLHQETKRFMHEIACAHNEEHTSLIFSPSTLAKIDLEVEREGLQQTWKTLCLVKKNHARFFLFIDLLVHYPGDLILPPSFCQRFTTTWFPPEQGQGKVTRTLPSQILSPLPWLLLLALVQRRVEGIEDILLSYLKELSTFWKVEESNARSMERDLARRFPIPFSVFHLVCVLATSGPMGDVENFLIDFLPRTYGTLAICLKQEGKTIRHNTFPKPSSAAAVSQSKTLNRVETGLQEGSLRPWSLDMLENAFTNEFLTALMSAYLVLGVTNAELFHTLTTYITRRLPRMNLRQQLSSFYFLSIPNYPTKEKLIQTVFSHISQCLSEMPTSSGDKVSSSLVSRDIVGFRLTSIQLADFLAALLRVQKFGLYLQHFFQTTSTTTIKRGNQKVPTVGKGAKATQGTTESNVQANLCNLHHASSSLPYPRTPEEKNRSLKLLPFLGAFFDTRGVADLFSLLHQWKRAWFALCFQSHEGAGTVGKIKRSPTVILEGITYKIHEFLTPATVPLGSRSRLLTELFELIAHGKDEEKKMFSTALFDADLGTAPALTSSVCSPCPREDRPFSFECIQFLFHHVSEMVKKVSLRSSEDITPCIERLIQAYLLREIPITHSEVDAISLDAEAESTTPTAKEEEGGNFSQVQAQAELLAQARRFLCTLSVFILDHVTETTPFQKALTYLRALLLILPREAHPPYSILPVLRQVVAQLEKVSFQASVKEIVSTLECVEYSIFPSPRVFASESLTQALPLNDSPASLRDDSPSRKGTHPLAKMLQEGGVRFQTLLLRLSQRMRQVPEVRSSRDLIYSLWIFEHFQLPTLTRLVMLHASRFQGIASRCTAQGLDLMTVFLSKALIVHLHHLPDALTRRAVILLRAQQMTLDQAMKLCATLSRNKYCFQIAPAQQISVLLLEKAKDMTQEQLLLTLLRTSQLLQHVDQTHRILPSALTASSERKRETRVGSPFSLHEQKNSTSSLSTFVLQTFRRALEHIFTTPSCFSLKDATQLLHICFYLNLTAPRFTTPLVECILRGVDQLKTPSLLDFIHCIALLGLRRISTFSEEAKSTTFNLSERPLVEPLNNERITMWEGVRHELSERRHTFTSSQLSWLVHDLPLLDLPWGELFLRDLLPFVTRIMPCAPPPDLFRFLKTFLRLRHQFISVYFLTSIANRLGHLRTELTAAEISVAIEGFRLFQFVPRKFYLLMAPKFTHIISEMTLSALHELLEVYSNLEVELENSLVRAVLIRVPGLAQDAEEDLPDTLGKKKKKAEWESGLICFEDKPEVLTKVNPSHPIEDANELAQFYGVHEDVFYKKHEEKTRFFFCLVTESLCYLT